MNLSDLRIRLGAGTSVLALSTALVALTALNHPASATRPAHETGIYTGGSTLASQVIRQIFDCYGNALAGDGFTPSTSFASNPPHPGLLPSACTTPAEGNANFEGLYAGTGSGRGRQAFIAHDSGQLYAGSGTTTTLPSVPPPYTDASSSDSYFNSYPYPSALLAFVDSDSALPGSPSNPGALTVTTLSGATVNYDTTDFGPAVQVPLLETPIAIPVNINGLSLKQAKPTNATSHMQLSAADVCAIFSGTVTHWNSTATVAGYDANGNVSTVKFDQDNNPNWQTSSTSTPFASFGLPITVVVRGDSSGTTAIFTNWLHQVCAPLDNGTNHYAAIFHGQVSTYVSLFTGATGGALPIPTNILQETGSNGVATAIGTSDASHGYIGYLSPDFTSRYSASPTAPITASLQDENQRITGVVHASASASFIPPTPASTALGFSNAVAPPAGATYPQWDLTAATTDPTVANAYPIVGVTYLEFYTCYAAGTAVFGSGTNVDGTLNDRYNSIVDFLGYIYPASGTASAYARDVIENNGFHELSTGLTTAVHNEFVTSTSPYRIAQPGQTTSCPSSANGA